MQKILLSLLLLICFSACKEKEGDDPEPVISYSCNLTKTSLEVADKGETYIKSFKEYEYDNLDRLIKVKDENNLITTYEYNIKSQPIKSTASSNYNVTIQDYEYDSMNRLIKTSGSITIIAINPSPPPFTYSFTISYDANGNRTRVDYKTSDGKNMYYSFKYENGNLTERYNSETGTTYLYEYYLDKNNKATMANDINPPIVGFPTASKNLLKSISYLDHGTPTNGKDIYTYELNEQGYVTKQTVRSLIMDTYIATTVNEYSCKN